MSKTATGTSDSSLFPHGIKEQLTSPCRRRAPRQLAQSTGEKMLIILGEPVEGLMSVGSQLLVFERSLSLSPVSPRRGTVASPELRSSRPGQDVNKYTLLGT